MTSLPKRNETIDIAKGIAIFCMVLGHCVTFPYKSIIYSFHMPFFFIIAGYFHKLIPPENKKEQLIKDIRRLYIPYIVFALLPCLKFGITKLCTGDINAGIAIVADWLIKAIWASGPRPDNGVIFGQISVIGPIWFLPALFWCKTLFNSICRIRKVYIPLCGAISYTSIYTFNHVINIPFALLTGMSGLIFYAIGYFIRRRALPYYMMIICAICWIYSIIYYPLSMANCEYGNYIVNIIGACGGTGVLLLFSKYVSKYSSTISHITSWGGRMSICILCFHFLNSIIDIPRRCGTDDWRIIILVEFAIIIPATIISTKLQITRSIFQLR